MYISRLSIERDLRGDGCLTQSGYSANQWVDERMDGRTDGWVDGWMNRRTDEWVNGYQMK